MINKTYLRIYRMTYQGEELAAWERAFNELPILKTDCKNERAIKERLIEVRAKKYYHQTIKP